MSNKQSLITLFYHHNLWSNLRLCDACLNLNAEQLNYTDPGSYGSIQRTLTHLVHAEERYIYHLVKWEPTHPTINEDQPTIADLKERVEESGKMLIQVAASTDSGKEAQVGSGDETESIPANIILLQAIHHAHEHRTQITSMMGQLGLQPPHLSGWTYFDEGLL